MCCCVEGQVQWRQEKLACSNVSGRVAVEVYVRVPAHAGRRWCWLQLHFFLLLSADASNLWQEHVVFQQL